MNPKGFPEAARGEGKGEPAAPPDGSVDSVLAGRVVTALIIGLIVGFAAGVFWQVRRLAPPAPQGAAETGDGISRDEEGESAIQDFSDTALAGTGFSVAAADQDAGESVIVARVSAREPVWVAVREVHGGLPGNILGAQKISEGKHQNISVELLRPTSQGAAYSVALYQATGSPAFNYREDVLIEGIQATFTAQ